MDYTLTEAKPERLQKILSAYGVASRREAEKMISASRVLVNGVPAKLGQTAIPDVDDIRVDGEPLPGLSKHYYIMLNKPCGYVTTVSDERGRKVVTELVTDIYDKAKIYPIGRLDLNSEGLLLLTNDGSFANNVMHPRYGLTKSYEVQVNGDINSALSRLKEPMDVDSRMVKATSVKLLKQVPSGGLISITIYEGRNKQVRKMCSLCGLEVLSLKRVAIGSVKLGNLPSGKWRHLTEGEINLLRG